MTYYIFRTSGLFINKQQLPKQLLDRLSLLKKKLTLKVYDYFTEQNTIYHPYFENDKYLVVPRNVDKFFRLLSPFTIYDMRRKLPIYDTKHNITPRDAVQDNAIKALSSDLYQDIILTLPPGKGKTVITIAALCYYNTKSIIVVDTRDIAQQWVDRIKQFTNVSDITMDTKLELTQQFNIVTIQKLLASFRKNGRELYKHIYNSNIGVVVFDEVHCLIGPKQFSKVCASLAAEKFIGVSATPYRADDTTKLIHWWLGNRHFVHTEDFKVDVKVYSYHSNIPHKTWKYICHSRKTCRARYLQQLAKRDEFYAAVMDVLQSLRKENRAMIVFFDRNDMIDKVSSRLSTLNIEHTKFYKNIGNKALNSNLILTNYIKCAKAIDAPHIDTIVYATGHNGLTILEQSKGRLQRIHKDKKTPLIVDIVDIDSGPSYNPANSFGHRYAFYIQNNYNIEFVRRHHQQYLKSLISYRSF